VAQSHDDDCRPPDFKMGLSGPKEEKYTLAGPSQLAMLREKMRGAVNSHGLC
jgi:hypothetical protein